MFRYQLLGLINRKLLILIGAFYLVAFLVSQFIAELAIINSATIAAATMADLVRYSLVVVLVISVSHQVSQDYDLNQFDRMLAMPITRSQYVVAQVLVLVVFSLLLALPMLVLFFLFESLDHALYWMFAVSLELVLVGHIALLAAISLERLPIAAIFAFALYLLAKVAPVILIIFSQSSEFYVDERGFTLAHQAFSILLFLLPDVSAFAQNNLLLEGQPSLATIFHQLLGTCVYSGFLLSIILLDFYRKEFNRT